MSFRDPQIEGKPKSAISIEIPFMFILFLLQKRKAHLFHLGLNQKPCTCKKYSFKKLQVFCLASQSCLSEVSEKSFFIDISSRYSNSFFPAGTGLNSPIKVSIENLNSMEEHSNRKSSSFKLHQYHENPKLPRIATNNVSSRYWNSYLSITTDLISVIRVPTKNYTYS